VWVAENVAQYLYHLFYTVFSAHLYQRVPIILNPTDSISATQQSRDRLQTLPFMLTVCHKRLYSRGLWCHSFLRLVWTSRPCYPRCLFCQQLQDKRPWRKGGDGITASINVLFCISHWSVFGFVWSVFGHITLERSSNCSRCGLILITMAGDGVIKPSCYGG
jgi:hypothetical protein